MSATSSHSSSIQSMSTPEASAVVKLKGLPFKAQPTDVLEFFAGFDIKEENIYLKRHPDGRPNGEAFIVFDSALESRRACQKDRETFLEKFGDRYVRVYPTLDSDLADMQAAMTQQATQQGGAGHAHNHSDSVVKIKSLPFDATQLDVLQFFDGFKMKANGVQLVVRSDNKPTGEAFVDFESPEEAGRAIREKDHKVFSDKFGDRYVRLIQVSRKEMQATLALRFGGEGILKMKGIPFKATAQDVRKFFLGYRIKPDGISFIMHADGRPTGMAFIEFETPQEAVRAMEKDCAKFGPEYGDRFCMLQLVGRHEMDKVTLQRESDAVSTLSGKLMSLQLQQAAALANAQAALNNPALLMAGTHPWLNSLSHLGFVNSMNPAAAMAAISGNPQLGLSPHHAAAMSALPGTGAGIQNPGTSLFDTAAFAQLQLANGSAGNGGGMNGGMGNGLNALSGLNLLPHQMAAGHVDPSVATANWVPQLPSPMVDPSAVNPLMYYSHLNGGAGGGGSGGGGGHPLSVAAAGSGGWPGPRTDSSSGYEYEYDLQRFRGQLMQQS